MFCKNCGAENADNSLHCTTCGAALERQAPAAAEPVYVEPAAAEPARPEIPEEYSPLSPWAYFGLTLLFSVPVVGFVFLIIFSINKSNINRRNFALSHWCAWIIGGAIFVLFLLVLLLLGHTVGDVVNEVTYY